MYWLSDGLNVMVRTGELLKREKMKKGVHVDRAEQVKWYEALDALEMDEEGVERGLQMARECRHPDAQWLASFFPPGVAVTRAHMHRVMLEHGEDPRALFLAWTTGGETRVDELMERAAEMGYAPAQVARSSLATVDDPTGVEVFKWAERAYVQGDFLGRFALSGCYLSGVGCTIDRERGIALLREVADVGYPPALFTYANTAFELDNWERYHWMGRALTAGLKCGSEFRLCSMHYLPAFQRGEQKRILHEVAPVVAKGLDIGRCTAFDQRVEPAEFRCLAEVVGLHGAMRRRARAAIACWSVVGLRCGVVKDVRVMIAKMAWEETWRW
jgi:TPR repeat protein